MSARSVIKEVEEEYGMPFWDVVRGFAEDGHSLTATAQLLGYASGSSFFRLISRHGADIKFNFGQDSLFSKEARESRKGKCTDAQREAIKAASAANPTYIRLEHNGITDTLAGHARRAGLSISTVRHRYRRNKNLDYVLNKGSHVTAPVGKGWHEYEFKVRIGKNE